jgi:hypothetical protein
VKVCELIEYLEGCDPMANVLLVTQQRYPLEHALRGVTTRERTAHYSERDGYELPDRASLTDVFLVQGSDIRHGMRDAWDACEN